MVAGFESFGVSCELGLVQRHCGLDRPSLFRFGFTPLDGLIAALNESLAAVADPAACRLAESPMGEWMHNCDRYGFERHTRCHVAKFTQHDAQQKLVAHAAFLAGKLLCDLRSGQKIFVHRPATPGSAADGALALAKAMAQHGDAVLLWLDLAQEPAQVGKVEWTVPGRIMTGYLDRFAPMRFAAAAPFDAWLRVLGAAAAINPCRRSAALVSNCQAAASRAAPALMSASAASLSV
jgi:hypothetical protein